MTFGTPSLTGMDTLRPLSDAKRGSGVWLLSGLPTESNAERPGDERRRNSARVYIGNRLVGSCYEANGSVPYWSHEELMAAAGAKLRRLLMVKGERRGKRVRFLKADAFEVFNPVDFIVEVLRGEIVIDFDCREQRPGSPGLRNHGTKFRIAPNAVCRVYMKKEGL